MTPAELASLVRLKTRTNSNTFSDTDILALLKIRTKEIARRLLDADEDLFLIPNFEDLVADKRQYHFLPNILSRIKRVEAKLDASDFIKLHEFNIAHYDKPTDETNITNNFSNEEGNAFFHLLHRSIYIYSGTITDVTNGLKLLLNTYPVVITDLASTIEMDQGQVDTELAIGSTDTKVSSTAFQYEINKIGYYKAAVAAGTALAAGTIPASTWGLYLFSIDSAGAITCTPAAANFTTGYATEALAIAALPTTPTGEASMGYITVLASASTFVGGTDALEDGTGGNPATTTNYYPTETEVPAIHGVPQELHELVARGIIIDYKESREKPIPLSETELKYEFDLGRAIESVKHGNLDRETIGELPPANTRGNNGQDY